MDELIPKGTYVIHFDDGATHTVEVVSHWISAGGDMLLICGADGSRYNFKNIRAMIPIPSRDIRDERTS